MVALLLRADSFAHSVLYKQVILLAFLEQSLCQTTHERVMRKC